MNLSNIYFDQEITFPEYTIRDGKTERTRFTDVKDINPIPNKSIVYKTVTGIGATHSEIIAERSSIIVLPHVSIVMSKYEDCKSKGISTVPIYADITQDEIATHLYSDSDYAKILTTPKGLDKLIDVMEKIRKDNSTVNYKNLFFLLIDECHKFIKDADYRADMVDVMDHFFEFENKAMVSATPLKSRDPRFTEQGFKTIKLVPDFDNRQEIDVISSNSLVNGFQTYLEENKSDHHCIFFNSVEGIRAIINQLGISEHSKIYCSKESSLILASASVDYATWLVDNNLKKFNFFTSSFFNGLDLHLDFKPNIVLLTDNNYRSHTLLDPYTDTLQIIGRFRRNERGEIPYYKITHINNSKQPTTPISEAEALNRVEQSKQVYQHIDTLKMSIADKDLEQLFNKALSTVKPYSKLLKKDGVLSYFRLDNYLDNERVKQYYTSSTALLNAYKDTKLYLVNYKNDYYDKEDLVPLERKSVRYSVETNRQMASYLLELEGYQGLNIYYEQQELIKKLSFLIYRGYHLLGYDQLAQLNFSRRKIEDALLKHDIESKKKSFPFIEVIYKEFHLNISYTRENIKNKLKVIYERYDLPAKAVATDLERYFEIKSVNTKKGNDRAFIFTERKIYPEDEVKHV